MTAARHFGYRPIQGFTTAAQRTRHRARLYCAQGGRCYLCPAPFCPAAPPTFDHVTPAAIDLPRSWSARRRGLLLAHADCNRRKASRPPHPCERLFLAAVQARLEARTMGVGSDPTWATEDAVLSNKLCARRSDHGAVR